MNELSGCLVSVLVATYNQAEYISQCLASLIDQTIPRSSYEIVVVDDGSTDSTAQIIADYSPNIEVVVTHPQRRGLVAACNTGLRRTQGIHILRVDSDDWLDTRAIEQLTGAVADQGTDIIIPSYWVVKDEQITIMRTDIQNVFTWMAGGSLLRREQVMGVGGYREFYWEEYDLYLRMLLQGAKVKGLHAPVLYHREHRHSMTAQKEDRTRGWQELADVWPSKTLREFGSHEELIIP